VQHEFKHDILVCKQCIVSLWEQCTYSKSRLVEEGIASTWWEKPFKTGRSCNG